MVHFTLNKLYLESGPSLLPTDNLTNSPISLMVHFTLNKLYLESGPYLLPTVNPLPTPSH